MPVGDSGFAANASDARPFLGKSFRGMTNQSKKVCRGNTLGFRTGLAGYSNTVSRHGGGSLRSIRRRRQGGRGGPLADSVNEWIPRDAVYADTETGRPAARHSNVSGVGPARRRSTDDQLRMRWIRYRGGWRRWGGRIAPSGSTSSLAHGTSMEPIVAIFWAFLRPIPKLLCSREPTGGHEC